MSSRRWAEGGSNLVLALLLVTSQFASINAGCEEDDDFGTCPSGCQIGCKCQESAAPCNRVNMIIGFTTMGLVLSCGVALFMYNKRYMRNMKGEIVPRSGGTSYKLANGLVQIPLPGAVTTSGFANDHAVQLRAHNMPSQTSASSIDPPSLSSFPSPPASPVGFPVDSLDSPIVYPPDRPTRRNSDLSGAPRLPPRNPGMVDPDASGPSLAFVAPAAASNPVGPARGAQPSMSLSLQSSGSSLPPVAYPAPTASVRMTVWEESDQMLTPPHTVTSIASAMASTVVEDVPPVPPRDLHLRNSWDVGAGSPSSSAPQFADHYPHLPGHADFDLASSPAPRPAIMTTQFPVNVHATQSSLGRIAEDEGGVATYTVVPSQPHTVNAGVTSSTTSQPVQLRAFAAAPIPAPLPVPEPVHPPFMPAAQQSFPPSVSPHMSYSQHNQPDYTSQQQQPHQQGMDIYDSANVQLYRPPKPLPSAVHHVEAWGDNSSPPPPPPPRSAESLASTHTVPVSGQYNYPTAAPPLHDMSPAQLPYSTDGYPSSFLQRHDSSQTHEDLPPVPARHTTPAVTQHYPATEYPASYTVSSHESAVEALPPVPPRPSTIHPAPDVDDDYEQPVADYVLPTPDMMPRQSYKPFAPATSHPPSLTSPFPNSSSYPSHQINSHIDQFANDHGNRNYNSSDHGEEDTTADYVQPVVGYGMPPPPAALPSQSYRYLSPLPPSADDHHQDQQDAGYLYTGATHNQHSATNDPNLRFDFHQQQQPSYLQHSHQSSFDHPPVVPSASQQYHYPNQGASSYDAQFDQHTQHSQQGVPPRHVHFGTSPYPESGDDDDDYEAPSSDAPPIRYDINPVRARLAARASSSAPPPQVDRYSKPSY